MMKRNYIFDTIRQVYKSYGYQQIETPAIENLDTLMGKYGEEGDRLIFKILNSGDYLKDLALTPYSLPLITKQISEKALRYDLTVPFARYVVQHQNEITFPFKRYQMQPVWRADRPQKGRYREFYQCDADVIGSNSQLNEVELIQIIDEVFLKLGIPIIIKINNRKILQGMAEFIGAPDKMNDIAAAIDQVEKINISGAEEFLKNKGFSQEQIDNSLFFLLTGKPKKILNIRTQAEEDFTNEYERSISNIASLKQTLNDYSMNSPLIYQGINEMKQVLDTLHSINENKIVFTTSLARGLNYYTGTIIEVKVDTTKCFSQYAGSLCGGGRYDDLTSIFGLPGISGVGISFGADRIYDVMEELNLFPNEKVSSLNVLFINFGDEELKLCFTLMSRLREAGITAELYPDAVKIRKQMSYANDKGISYVVFLGNEEMKKGILKVKNMISGEEKEMKMDDLKEYLLQKNESSAGI